MTDHLCIAVTFLDGRYHGRRDGGEPEWPPSPLRLLQSIVAANAEELGRNESLIEGIEWLERQPPPTIVAPSAATAAPHCLSVPNNNLDLVGRAWSRGNVHGTGDANPAKHRTMKTVRPTRLNSGGNVRFLWAIGEADAPTAAALEAVQAAARRVYAVGWGVDLVAVDATIAHGEPDTGPADERWRPSGDGGGVSLRIPVAGSCVAMSQRHTSFLHRTAGGTLAPVDPLTAFGITAYRRPTDARGRPFRLFALRRPDGKPARYPHRRLIHLAGMVRHLAIEAMKAAPPTDAPDDWVDTFVAGHAPDDGRPHRQLSYLPLPSIGMPHTDPGVRRFMLVAPPGHAAWLDHVARRLEHRTLRPLRGDEFPDGQTPMLVPIRGDNVTRRYTTPARVWHSFTPVILPGHDDRKSAKRRKLVEKALVQSGIDQPCEFECSPISRFRKACTAHKHDRRGRPQGFLRPDHLLDKTAVHLTLRFGSRADAVDPESDWIPADAPFHGPLVIGAGRHCGFGLMVGDDS